MEAVCMMSIFFKGQFKYISLNIVLPQGIVQGSFYIGGCFPFTDDQCTGHLELTGIELRGGGDRDHH